jgi:hypothetical protein
VTRLDVQRRKILKALVGFASAALVPGCSERSTGAARSDAGVLRNPKDAAASVTDRGLSEAGPAPSDAGALAPLGSAPEWFLHAPERAWLEVAAGALRDDLSQAQRGARILDVAPDPAPPGNEGILGVTADWTGGCALQARGEYLLPAQGGHSGYYGNEIYALALRNATPAWQRIWGPTPNAQISTSEFPSNAPYTAYADGSPRTLHGWYHVQASQTDERVWLLMIDACPSGLATTETYSIARGDLGAGWTYHGRLWTDVGGSSDFFYQTGPSAYDALTNTLWQAAEQSNIAPFMVKVDVRACVAAGKQPPTGPQVPGSSGYLGYQAADLGSAWSAIASDLKPRCWILGSPARSHLYVLDLEDPGHGFVSKNASGTPPPDWGRSMGAVYHRPSQALLVGGIPAGGRADSRVWKLSVPSDPLQGSYSWSTIVSAGGVTPQAPSQYQGAWSKWQMIEDMGNGQSAIVYVTDVRGPAYVYKLPMAGV